MRVRVAAPELGQADVVTINPGQAVRDPAGARIGSLVAAHRGADGTWELELDLIDPDPTPVGASRRVSIERRRIT